MEKMNTDCFLFLNTYKVDEMDWLMQITSNYS
jgi:hypothetical protein